MYFDFALEEKHSQQTTSIDLPGGKSMGSTHEVEKLQLPQTWILYRHSDEDGHVRFLFAAADRFVQVIPACSWLENISSRQLNTNYTADDGVSL